MPSSSSSFKIDRRTPSSSSFQHSQKQQQQQQQQVNNNRMIQSIALPCRVIIPGILFIIFLLPLTYLILTHNTPRNNNNISDKNIRVPKPHAKTQETQHLLDDLKQLNEKYQHISDTTVYNRYARVYDRKIRFPTGHEYSFDIWGRVWKNDSFSVVTIIPFDQLTQTFTLIREFNPAHNCHVYSFPQGMVEFGSKHPTLLHAAAAELEEEAHLKCNQWLYLLDVQDDDGGRQSQAFSSVPQDKYQREKVYMYLCIDSSKIGASDAASVDEEEEIEIVRGVTVKQIFQLSRAGVLQSNNVAAGLLAIEQLRQLDLIPSRTS